VTYPEFLADFNFRLAAGKILRVGAFVEAHPFWVKTPVWEFLIIRKPLGQLLTEICGRPVRAVRRSLPVKHEVDLSNYGILNSGGIVIT
jgi:hypothetical protein